MMENAVEIVKKHPIAIGVGVLILLLLMAKGGSTSGGTNTALLNASLQSQQTAGQTDIALSGINAQSAAARTQVIGGLWEKSILANAQQAIATGANQTQLVMAALSHQENLTAIDAQQSVQEYQISAAQASAALSMNTQLQLNRDNIAGSITMAQLADGTARYQIDAASGAARYQVDAAGNALHEQLGLQYYQTESAAGLTRYGMDLTSANLPQILQSQNTARSIAAANAEALASINGQTAQAIAALNTSASRTSAQAAADHSSNSDTMSWVTTAASLFALFSDPRLKTDIVCIGTHPSLGIGIYTYRYLNGEFGCGVMADELAIVKPQAVINHASGYMMIVPGMM